MISTTTQPQRVARLRELLAGDGIVMLPSCYDGLSAKLVERAGYDATFMTGFGVAASHGLPDTQLLSYGEMERSARTVCSSLKAIPCIGDGDTGYGNALNVKRTVAGYALAGMAGIMIEDQVSPKRCGHTKGKEVVPREDAFNRVKAAVDARREGNFDILIMARTDARATHSLDEAIERCQEFARLGADITFLEAPRSVDEMREYCRRVPGPKAANMVEMGLTPVLPAAQLEEIGYKIAIYPVTLLNASIKVMEQALEALRDQHSAAASSSDADLGDQKGVNKPNTVLNGLLNDFAHVKDVVGFNDYYKEEERYNIARFE